ncbi:MAG: cytochrome b [Rhodanobacteraceae bacterium]|nr:cytochrome b [Rhodanobacteraceae bacterium]
MDAQNQGYGAVARALHWLMAALMILQWFSGEESKAFGGMSFHFSLGLTLMLLVLIRLGWRVTHPVPALPSSAPAWERTVARLMHLSWYLLMLALPLSGILYRQFRGKTTSWFGLADLPAWLSPDKYWAHQSEDIHKILGTVFLVLLTLHVVAALKHHFIDRDGVLRGMLVRVAVRPAR